MGTGTTITSKFSGYLHGTPGMVLGAKNWGVMDIFLYRTATAGRAPGEWVQAYHYGSTTTGMGSRGLE